MDLHLQPLHLPTVVVMACAMMLMVAVLMTLFGHGQVVYQGLRVWLGAQWAATAGVASLMWVDTTPALWPLSAMLLMQWPVAVLIGLRRFHPRAALPGSITGDILFFCVCLLIWLAADAVPSAGGAASMILPLALGALHLRAAAVVGHLPALARRMPLSALRVMLVGGGLAQVVPIVVALAGSGEPGQTEAAIVLPLAMDATMVLMLCMVLTHERAAEKLEESHARMRVLANVDSLTGMPNRRHFRELADQTLAHRAGRMTLMLFDIDHFKQVNDQYGHEAGDDALKLLALAARRSFRGRDIVARLGGDEFIALLPDASREEAMRVADRMVKLVATGQRRDQSKLPPLGLSFGIVSLCVDEDLDSAVRRADAALYEAKRQGRCRAVLAETEEETGMSVFAESRPLGLDEAPAKAA